VTDQVPMCKCIRSSKTEGKDPFKVLKTDDSALLNVKN